MRRLIGTLAIIAFFYLGFVGCEKHKIDPFILEWLKSDDTQKEIKKIKKVTNEVVEDIEESSEETKKALDNEWT